MRSIPAALAAVVLLAGCGEREPTPAEKAAKDARDIALVEAAQQSKPPPEAIEPAALTAAEADRYGASTHCAFVPADSSGPRPILLAGEDRAWLKVGERVHGFAADRGSSRLAGGAWPHYDGKDRSLSIEQEPGDGVTLGDDRLRWAATLTVRDAWDQVVYRRSGDLECGA